MRTKALFSTIALVSVVAAAGLFTGSAMTGQASQSQQVAVCHDKPIVLELQEKYNALIPALATAVDTRTNSDMSAVMEIFRPLLDRSNDLAEAGVLQTEEAQHTLFTSSSIGEEGVSVDRLRFIAGNKVAHVNQFLREAEGQCA